MRPLRAIFGPLPGVYGVPAGAGGAPSGSPGAPPWRPSCADRSAGTAATPALIVVRKSRLFMRAILHTSGESRTLRLLSGSSRTPHRMQRMKNLFVGFAVLMASVAVFAQTPAASDVVGVGNFSHVVRDMDRAVAFYRDVLGLEVGASQPFSPNPAIMRLGNTPGAQSKMVQLRVPGSTMGVELLEYKDIERKVQTPRFFDPGAANIALRVRDLAPILAK